MLIKYWFTLVLHKTEGKTIHIWNGTILSDIGFESHNARKNRFQKKEVVISHADLDWKHSQRNIEKEEILFLVVFTESARTKLNSFTTSESTWRYNPGTPYFHAPLNPVVRFGQERALLFLREAIGRCLWGRLLIVQSREQGSSIMIKWEYFISSISSEDSSNNSVLFSIFFTTLIEIHLLKRKRSLRLLENTYIHIRIICSLLLFFLSMNNFCRQVTSSAICLFVINACGCFIPFFIEIKWRLLLQEKEKASK